MAAVLGPTPEEIQEVIDSVTAGVCEIANLNSPGQTVVAGDIAGVEDFQKRMGEKGAKLIPLNVSAPFHCRLMKPAAEKLAADLDGIKIRDPRFPVYANVSAKFLHRRLMGRSRHAHSSCATIRSRPRSTRPSLRRHHALSA